MAAAPAATTSPATAASSPIHSSGRPLLRLPRRGLVSPPAPDDQRKVLSEDGPDGTPARCGDHGGTAGGLPDSGPPSPSSSRIVTTESYGLSGPSWPRARAWLHRRKPPPAPVLVSRKAARGRSG